MRRGFLGPRISSLFTIIKRCEAHSINLGTRIRAILTNTCTLLLNIRLMEFCQCPTILTRLQLRKPSSMIFTNAYATYVGRMKFVMQAGIMVFRLLSYKSSQPIGKRCLTGVHKKNGLTRLATTALTFMAWVSTLSMSVDMDRIPFHY